MTDRRYFKLFPVDVALRIELIHRVHGLEAAEYYFNNLSNHLKRDRIYGALLSGYVREKSVDKAEAIMQKMREMDMAASSFPYNMLINLYSQTGEHDKIDMLMQEMERKGIPQDKYTMLNRMAAYIAVFDISGMERILNRMEDKHFFASWKVYSMAASGYLKVGLIEKALAMLKKMEENMPLLRRKLALKFLLTHYANTGHKKELYRVWNMYKPSKELIDGPIDGPYACMVSSLAKLGDIEGAEKIFEEWETHCTMYDFRVLNSLLAAYCKNGLCEKAESVVEKAVEGRTPYSSTWGVLAVGYMEDKNMPKAIEMLKKALLIGREGWRPNSITLANCLDYLEEQGDVKGMEEFLRLLKNSGPLSREMYHSLLRTCVRNGKSVSEILDQMKIDGFTADEETERILGT